MENILIIDDEPGHLHLLKSILNQKGIYRIFTADGGEEGLEIFKDKDIDLVICDIIMPDIDGYEVAEKIKAKTDEVSVPLIFITALDEPDAKLRAFESGAEDLITRPFNASEVISRVEIHLKLRRARKKLENKNRELEEFANIIAHDLKEPLRSCLNYTNLLQKNEYDGMDDTAKKYFDYVAASAARMNERINELLKYTRLSTFPLEYETVDLNLLFEELMEDLSYMISEKNAVIKKEVLPEVSANYTLLYHLFQNLVSNAVKFNDKPRPEIFISADVKESDLEISLRDNGIGINPALLADIYKPFFRGPNAVNYPGSGMGLAVCHKIVQRHGGEIDVTSAASKGSEFLITLPLRKEIK